MTVTFNKSKGQHILRNPGIIDKIIEKSHIKPTDTVLEIGGGTGNLTMKLLEKCKKVICYESDERLAAELLKRVNEKKLNHKLHLIVGDVLKHDIPHFDLCVSNIPYKISSVLIFKLLKYHHKRSILMVQEEFGRRLIARPGNSEYSRLSVTVQLKAKTEILMKVKKNNFNPPPKVESCVVMITPRYPKVEVMNFDNIVGMCFVRKNKTLKSVLKKYPELNDILKENGLSDKRASKLDINDFLKLLYEIEKKKITLKNLK
ncbi:putative dimethyladenosine transferase [Dictyocoela muelleri]|nr:putative dimethyladenosine transferase [Dictyocoela muelleri]